MKFTRFQLHKNQSLPPLSVPTNIRYCGPKSQPHHEVTAHTDVRRRSLSRPVPTALAMMVWLLSGAGLLGCRPHPEAEPAPPRSAVQVLIQAAPVINPGHHGEPWPTALTIYQLRGDPEAPDHEPFDLVILEARGDAAFGDLLIGKRDYTAFPGTHARLVVPLGPDATHLVAVAHFREPLGDAALLIFPVPDTRSADPCFYLGLERSELDGGEFPPPGFDPTAFATICPIPGRPVPAASSRPAATALAITH